MITRRQFISYISEGRFLELFVTELGWNRFRNQAQLPAISVDGTDYAFTTIAERNGFQIVTCFVETIPTNSICKKIDSKLRRQANDYIAIYRLSDTEHHLWTVPVRANEKRDLVLVEYETAEKADLLYSKIEGISFDLGEETTILDLRAKVQGAFAVNSEKITKEFYAGFKKEHTAFVKFISGIDDEIADKENKAKHWYASIMLNRLMFCYFIQKKGFLNYDFDYLRHKLEWVRQERGENRFFSTFYKGFLIKLFHGGLNSPQHAPEFEQVYGKIPYLNGGMFDIHILEERNTEIDIDDQAFIRLFDFFDTWRWHLDTRITASGKDINPDVLGYIFEQYINDRAQMGAYYTKEDITEYIGRNCILPFLFDKVRSKNATAFKPDGFVWSTLRNSGDRYIFDAVKKGSDRLSEIPQEVSRGIITQAMRGEYSATPVGELPAGHIPLSTLRSEWNKPTPEPWALPTEIWRETIERLQRCQSIKAKIAAGEITQINDFITYNLDIRLFAADLLASADRLFIKHFYEALQNVTILDPTCGSGAFLFAAMNILEPLYEVCIERMQEDPNYFKAQLSEISDKYRSNIQYFIFKSIILRNLYGVDIMVEATEIAKLRLFLKMVAVVDVDLREPNLGLDPLPDIDFNIRCGNTLVGYANEAQLNETLHVNKKYSLFFEEEIAEFRQRIDEELDAISKTYKNFKKVQLEQEINQIEFKKAKAELAERLAVLNSLLNEQLFDATHQDIKENREKIYQDWKESHQPFHWLAEFYQIIHGNGGFDVIIGNPPYVEKRDINYSLSNYKTWESGAVHLMCIERSKYLLNNTGAYSMIVPMSLVCTQRMKIGQLILEENRSVWYSNFAWRPAHLFEGVSRSLTIFINLNTKEKSIFSTSYIKWTADIRNQIFKNLHFIEYNEQRNSFWMPKFQNELEKSILNKVLTCSKSLNNFVSDIKTDNILYYRNTGGVYWKIFTTYSPFYSCNGTIGSSSRETTICFREDGLNVLSVGLLSSNLFWWWYSITGNLRDLNPSDIMGFKFPHSLISDDEIKRLSLLYEEDVKKHSSIKIRIQKTKGETKTQSFKISKSKYFINLIDERLSIFYGFTEEELYFIINYDLKYRMSDELNSEE